jgi:uncharacterized membrane protein YtjA (UPF0391 family)
VHGDSDSSREITFSLNASVHRRTEAGSAPAYGEAVLWLPGPTSQRPPMLHYTLVFLVIALIAALFGFGGIAAGAVNIAQILFFVFMVLAIATFFGSMKKP